LCIPKQFLDPNGHNRYYQTSGPGGTYLVGPGTPGNPRKHEIPKKSKSVSKVKVIQKRYVDGLCWVSGNLLKKIVYDFPLVWGCSSLAPTPSLSFRPHCDYIPWHNTAGEPIISYDFLRQLTMLPIEKIGDCKNLEILVQNQSFWNIVGARPTGSTSQQRER